MDKLNFIIKDVPELLIALEITQQPKWGKMNALQMADHLTESVQIANGKIPKKILLTAEQVEKARAFMLSEKPFRENTVNIEMPEIPLPASSNTMEEATEKYRAEINNFVHVFSAAPDKTITNPFFGDLNFEQWTHLLHKHITHHLKQFSLL